MAFTSCGVLAWPKIDSVWSFEWATETVPGAPKIAGPTLRNCGPFPMLEVDDLQLESASSPRSTSEQTLIGVVEPSGLIASSWFIGITSFRRVPWRPRRPARC